MLSLQVPAKWGRVQEYLRARRKMLDTDNMPTITLNTPDMTTAHFHLDTGYLRLLWDQIEKYHAHLLHQRLFAYLHDITSTKSIKAHREVILVPPTNCPRCSEQLGPLSSVPSEPLIFTRVE